MNPKRVPDKVRYPFISRKNKNLLKDSVLRYPYHVFDNFMFRFRSRKFYGQTAEDALLQRLLPEKEGSYFDIGGGHPIKYSNTYAFYRRGWSGISVDAIKFNTKIYRLMRPRDSSIHALIGDSNEMTDFFVFEPYGLSTADPEVAKNVLKIKDVRLLETIQLRTVRLSEIMPNITPYKASFLSVDVEGLDLQVLKTNDWTRFRPRVICVENWGGVQNSTTSEIAAYLDSKNYRMHAFTGLSEIYIAKDYSSD
jgi:FkbM family methyltransferase